MNLDAKVTGFKLSDYNILFIVYQSCFSEKKTNRKNRSSAEKYVTCNNFSIQ